MEKKEVIKRGLRWRFIYDRNLWYVVFVNGEVEWMFWEKYGVVVGCYLKLNRVN